MITQEPGKPAPTSSGSLPAETPTSVIPPLRVAVGLGDPERERTLLPALKADSTILVTERCLSADQLISCVEAGTVDTVLLADDLHRLTDDALLRLARSRLPIIVLAAQPDDQRWQTLAWVVLPLDAPPDAVRQAVLAARPGATSGSIASNGDRLPRPEAAAAKASPGELATIAIASGHGSPGRTVVALNLAVALGAVAPTVLVDADAAGPSLAAYLDLDPTRNLFMLAHADPRSPRDWDQAIAAETQTIGRHAVAVCGLPKPAMRAAVSAHFIEQLLSELGQRYRFVILDIGADLLGAEAGLHRLALGASQQVIFVASADLVGLWHARVGLNLLDRSLSIEPERVALVINRYDRRYHHSRGEIEWALDRPIAAIVPEDPGHVQRAILAQSPVVIDRRSHAGRSLLDLAERIHGGRIVLPREDTIKRRGRWLRPRGLFRQESNVVTGGRDEHDLAATR